MKHLSLACLLLALCLVSAATAQVGLNGQTAGVGTITWGPFSTDALNGGNAQLGIQYYPGDGNFYVSRRGTGTSTVAPHEMLVVNQSGALVTAFAQGPGATGGVWGHRDGATDGYAGGNSTFWGDDFGIHCYDHTTTPPTYVTGPTTVFASNGPQIATFPLAVQGLTGGITRSLEYNPAGNGGNGSFWAVNFGTALVEFDLNGVVLNSFPVTTNNPAWSGYGLAMNLQTGMLWVNSSPAGSATVVASMAEIDPATGIFTGRRIRPAGTSGAGTSPWVYAAQGGLCYVQGRSGPTHGPAGAPPFSELAVLTQGTPDYIACHRLDLYSNFDSALETQIELSLNNGPFLTTPQAFGAGSLVSLQYNTPAANPGSPIITVINIFGGPGTPTGTLFGIPEYTILNNLYSTPTAIGSGVLAFTIGDGFNLNGLVAQNLLLMPPATQPLSPTIPFPLPSLLGPGTELSIQGLYLTGSGQPIATNRVLLTEL